MIVRAILDDPELANKFDYFNDYRDTHRWLNSLESSSQQRVAIQALDQGYNKWRDSLIGERT